ncbi:uncharacterized protein J3D65DRAFT_354539 [Phyllosticta citribraziliensis]|uniref:NAD(P)-binding protein n=1 Tax=Phyllosticta citribraziliensis TaxID=989973 RepID=A0ABR1LNP6_9PEZI
MSRPTINHLTQTLHRTVYSAIDPASPSNSAAGKRVVISSGATGIGYAIAQSFVTAHAAVVILLARRADALEEAADKLRAYAAEQNTATTIWTYTLDIRDDAATGAVFKDVRRRLNEEDTTPDGKEEQNQDVDILVTSAAYFAPHNLFLSFSTETLRESFDTNVLGNANLVRAFLRPEIPFIPFTPVVTQAAQPATKADPPAGAKPPTRAKVVLDVSSITTCAVVPGVSAYGASKLAFTRLMAHLQAEVSTALPHIRIHSFHPGAIYSPAMQKTGFAPDFIRWDDESLPAGFAVWLACNEEAAFLKGRFVFAAWDVGEMVAMRERFEKEPGLCRISLDV